MPCQFYEKLNNDYLCDTYARLSSSGHILSFKGQTEMEEILACRKIILLIVRYMKENGLNQKELAEKLSVSSQHINRLFNGQDINF